MAVHAKRTYVDLGLLRVNRASYAGICNVSQRLVTDAHPTIGTRSSKWNKIAWIMELLVSYSTIVWLDMDAFVVRPKCGWLRQRAPLSIAHDDYDASKFNSGVMVVNRAAMPFLRRVWTHNDFGRGISDQRSINHLIRNMSYPVETLDRIYNAFPPPPRRCGAYVPPVHRRSAHKAVVRHYAGQFMGGRTTDGRIEECAFRQLKLRRDAISLVGREAEDTVSDKRTLLLGFVGSG